MLTIEEVCQAAQQIPCSPSLLPEVVRLLNQPDAGIDELEGIIHRDPGLSAAVLKMANSAFFSSGQSFDNLSDAILRLGFKQTYRITVSVSGGRWNSFDLSAYGWQPGDFCRHSFAVAVASRFLAEKTEAIVPELAFTAGMIHDAGKLALAYMGTEYVDPIRDYQREHQCDWFAAERKVLGFTHAEVTGALLKNWNFPENLIDVGLHYATPASAREGNELLLAVVHGGKHLAIQTGVGLGEDAFWTPLDPTVIEQLGASEEDLRLILPDLIESLKALLHRELLTGKISFD
ncbi:MAG: HDOD domain-containing protein [Oceanipulchritudo sp.]